MCGTPGTVFAWFGALFINISFGFLIAWGITTQWLIGLSLSFIYSCILFFVSFRLSKQVIIENFTVPEVLSDNVEESNQGSSSESTKQGLRTLVVLLYTLAVISIGVTGLIIPMNIFYCDYPHNYPWDYYNHKWDTNTSSLPNDVQTWYNKISNGSIDHSYKDFASLPNSNVLLFGGNNGTGDELLYKYDGTTVTPYKDFKNPYDFVISSDNESICVAGYYETNDNDMHPTSTSTIACYNGNNDKLRFMTYYNTSNEYKDFYNPTYLYPSTNNTLWFIASSNNDYYYNSPPVFSLNDQSMVLTLHSTLTEQNGKKIDVSCDKYKVTRSRAIVSIITSIIPTFIAALVLHKRLRFIPSMSIIIYTCITVFIIALVLSIQPMFTKMGLVLRIWLCSSSGMWLSYMVVVFLFDTIVIENNSIKEKKTSHFVWNINFVSLVFFFTMAWSLGIPVPYYDTWWRWVVINLTVYIPYIFSGILIETILLVLLGAIGIFENAWRFSNLIANQINDPSFQIVLQVVLFAIIGLFIGLFGWKVNQYQRDIQVCVRGWISRYFAFLRKRGSEEVVLQSDVHNDSASENDGVHTAVSIL